MTSHLHNSFEQRLRDELNLLEIEYRKLLRNDAEFSTLKEVKQKINYIKMMLQENVTDPDEHKTK